MNTRTVEVIALIIPMKSLPTKITELRTFIDDMAARVPPEYADSASLIFEPNELEVLVAYQRPETPEETREHEDCLVNAATVHAAAKARLLRKCGNA